MKVLIFWGIFLCGFTIGIAGALTLLLIISKDYLLLILPIILFMISFLGLHRFFVKLLAKGD